MTDWPLVLLEPADCGPAWTPFAGTRPLAELRAGAFRVWERWQRALDAASVSVLSAFTPKFADVDSIPLVEPDAVRGPAIVARSTFLPVDRHIAIPPETTSLGVEGRTVAWILGPGDRWGGPRDLAGGLEVRGAWLTGVVDLLTACESLLADDCVGFLDQDSDGVPAGAVVLGDPRAVIVRGALVEPQVVFDVRKGPIVLEANALVRAGSRLEGPLYIGPHTWVLGGSIRQSAIGPHCRVHGEVADSVFLGYANKSHDGFVGHSVVGHWANLGAGTITSNLKNTYGEVRLAIPGAPLATGRRNVGTFFGDHVKTAIGTLLPTGAVIGAGAHVFGGPAPRYLRAFAWGTSGTERIDADRFVAVASRVLPRRGVDLTPEIAASLRAIHARLTR